jgi:hypothetical protein
MAMFSVYFDDSGTDKGSAVAVAACYIGTSDQWKCLEADWRQVGDREGFATFHMSECLASTGEFKGWEWEKKDRVIKTLISITKARARIGLVYAVRKVDYDSLVTGPLRDRVGRYHYSFVIRKCLNEIWRWRQDFGVQGPLRYVFDRMSEGKGEIEAILSEMSQSDGEALGLETGGWSFENKKHLIPLQCADILANQGYRHMSKCVLSGTGLHYNSNDYMTQLHDDSWGLVRNGYFSYEVLKKFATATAGELDGVGWHTCPPLSRTSSTRNG